MFQLKNYYLQYIYFYESSYKQSIGYVMGKCVVVM